MSNISGAMAGAMAQGSTLGPALDRSAFWDETAKDRTSVGALERRFRRYRIPFFTSYFTPPSLDTSIHIPHKFELPGGGVRKGDVILMEVEVLRGAHFKINGIAFCTY